MDSEIATMYGKKVRVRVCGICWQGNSLLVANHRSLTPDQNFWAPPGGGLEFGESTEDALKREFQEETNLEVSVGQFLFACEFLHPPLHGIELYFEVIPAGGELMTGNDPELPIIKDVQFLSESELLNKPPAQLHGLFKLVGDFSGLKKLRGFHRI